MKKSLLVCLYIFMANSIYAQSIVEVEEAVGKFRTAMLAEDAESLQKLTSANLSYGHSSGLIETQAEFVAVFASKKSDYQKWDVNNQEISFNGKELAMVRQFVDGEIVTNGVLNALKLGLLMVWVKEKGEWKLLARQAFRTPQS